MTATAAHIPTHQGAGNSGYVFKRVVFH